MSEGRVHSRFAPSSLERIIACPNSVALAEQALAADPRRRQSSVWAAEGSVAHLVAEQYLRDGRSRLKVGKVVKYDGHDIVITDDMHEHAINYRSYVRDLHNEGDGGDSSITMIEEVVKLDQVVGADARMYGHLDAAVAQLHAGALHVVDYKFGAGIPVKAEDNPQLMAYALGALALLEVGGETWSPVETTECTDVYLHIVQPRVRSRPSIAHLPMVDLLMWGDDTLAPLVRSILDGTTPEGFTTGPHCRFCPAAAICPAWAEKALSEAQEAFGGEPPAKQPGAALAAALARVRELQPWIDAIEDEAKARLLATSIGDDVVPGFKPVVSQWRRAWSKTTTAGILAKALGLKSSVIHTAPVLRTPADLEKLLPKERRSDLAPYVTRKPHGTMVVPVDDRRPDSREEVQATPDDDPTT